MALFLKNRLARVLHPEKKIFFIGFNKTATTALHYFLKEQGVASIHFGSPSRTLAIGIESRLDDLHALRRYLWHWMAISDLTLSSEERMLDGNRYFVQLHQAFPDAYFVLNERNEDDWIASRSVHYEGQFLRRSMRFHNADADEVAKIWRETFRAHKAAALSYFADNDRFMVFKVDADPIEALIAHLAPTYSLSPHYWKRWNTTSPLKS